jgi:translation initiation factor IF-3
VGFRRRRWRDVRPEADKVRVNKNIRVPEVRVVNEDGQQLGVMGADAARDIAARIGLDLVEISPTADPPVCKIMDYGRYKYELKKKAATARKAQHQTQIKEVKFRPQISDHDRAFKIRNARKFLFEGDKVKCTVMFRGREIVHTQIGRDLLSGVLEELAEISTVEHQPQMEGRTLTTTLAPVKSAIEKQRAVEERQKRLAEQEAEQESEQDSEKPAEASPTASEEAADADAPAEP